ncbi:MAG: hypothetical protein H0X51_04120 [Parachlamydiaceae bacterium]|nr:hypothetical protein [Parachlamydiaceae bacterium]
MPIFENPFLVKTCSLASIATGAKANSLLELHDKLVSADEGCIYYHFWGRHMTPQFGHVEYHNDFARWAHDALDDHVLAERLNIIDPTEFTDLESIRQAVLETIEESLEEEVLPWIKKEDRFHFIRSTIIVFESEIQVNNPEELALTLPKLPPSSIFYHFIDARRRTVDRTDDFSVWLKTFGSKYDQLIQQIQGIDPYFLSLTQLRDKLTELLKDKQ